MVCIDDAQFAGALVSLRAKVSHSWLDHEISMVDAHVAVARCRAGTWPLIAGKWQAVHELALEFGERLGQFSSATLVDMLPAFQTMASADKRELKARLDALHSCKFDTPRLRVEYSALLQILWNRAESFFRLVEQPSASELELVTAWERVRDAGADLKTMFTSGQIPKGVVMP